ncbi:MAG: oxidoreductase [Anaerolineales bacterium]|nr:oxidoreductase [Anaerolineae bacterium]PWB55837.1 MAG: oxidoreductase [Anaerolineales bacterium]
MAKPTVAVYKFSSCDGCQLSLLNLEDELLDLVGVVELAYFLEARRQTLPGPYDIALVEGSVSTPHEAERIQEIRKQCKTLVAIGACATSGGIQALRNTASLDDLALKVYEHPEYLHSLPTSTPIAEHVKVDYELWGCPVNKYQLVEVIQAFLQKRRPNLPSHSICLDCKRKGVVCVMVAYGMPCLGPGTRTGCGVLCPSNGRGCYGCFGPAPHTDLKTVLASMNYVERHPGEVKGLLLNISNNAPAFRQAVDLLPAVPSETTGGKK